MRPSPGRPFQLDQNLITMHGRAKLCRTDKNVASELGAQLTAFGNRKAVAITMHGEPAHHQVAVGGLDGQRITVPAGEDEFAALNHFGELFFQLSPLGAVQAQLTDELLVPCRLMRQPLDMTLDQLLGNHARPWKI